MTTSHQSHRLHGPGSPKRIAMISHYTQLPFFISCMGRVHDGVRSCVGIDSSRRNTAILGRTPDLRTPGSASVQLQNTRRNIIHNIPDSRRVDVSVKPPRLPPSPPFALKLQFFGGRRNFSREHDSEVSCSPGKKLRADSRRADASVKPPRLPPNPQFALK